MVKEAENNEKPNKKIENLSKRPKYWVKVSAILTISTSIRPFQFRPNVVFSFIILGLILDSAFGLIYFFRLLTFGHAL